MNANEKFFNEAVNLELNIASLYRLFATLHSNDEKFWREIASEEDNHAAMIRLLEKQFLEGAADMINHLNIERLADINQRISMYLDQVELEGIARTKAFDIAMQMEHQVYELQFRDILSQLKHPAIKDLFAVLAEKDKEHVNKLKKYVSENYV